jgi:3-hydroxyacyl-CoA dehydrogenase / 3-hydroxy-2-methylbutyryl-CoA dehydrogenase
VELTGKSAIVTGGAGGLGSATARHLAKLGLGVVVLDRDGDRARAVAAELGLVAAVGGDTSDDDAVTAAIEAARPAGTLSVVVNVAGGGNRPTRVVARDGTPHSMATFADTITKNVFGTFNVTRLAAAAMAASEPDEDGERGVVVNTASVAGYEGQAGQVPYAAAKAAILGMSLPLARDLSPLGIRVCAIAPGTMGTELMMSAGPELRQRLEAGIVFPKRMGHPAEFAQLVEFIIRNPYLNGENIRLDAAQRLPPR